MMLMMLGRDGRTGRRDGIFDRRPGRVRREERQRFHQLVTLGYGYVAVVQLPGRFAIHVEPPVALEYCLVEQGRLGTQEALLRQPVVGERAHVEHLYAKIKIN